jgi:hypothetical protein
LRRKSKNPQTSSTIGETTKEELNSFGVFLGSFENPPTVAQQQLLSQWDVLVVDPFQEGVLNALSTCQPSSKHVLGRVDIQTLSQAELDEKTVDITKILAALVQTLDSHVLNEHAAYSGVLLAGFREHLQPAVMNELAKHIKNLGLDLWLELSFPEYLTEDEARAIDMKFVKGIVYRNGTIRPDGDRQNYFQMDKMRTVMRAVAGQRVAHGPALIMWETIDEDQETQFAVVIRTYNWCTYNSALCWVGHADAQFDAEIARTRSLRAKPLGALMWLKNEKNMNAHDVWRENDKVGEVDAPVLEQWLICWFAQHYRSPPPRPVRMQLMTRLARSFPAFRHS